MAEQPVQPRPPAQRPAQATSAAPVRSAARPTATNGEPGRALGDRLRRAWLTHPVVAFARHRKLVSFYRQLHSLVRAGIALPTAFAQLVQYAPDAAMAQGLTAVANDVREGATLGEAMRRHAALFDDANVELIAFAEESGRLERVIATLLDHMEKVQAQRWQALLGSLWPLYLGASFVFVGPLLSAAQQLTPGASVGALYLSNLAGTLGTAVAALGAVLGAPFLVAMLGREVEWDALKRRLPGLSMPLRALAASRFMLGLGLANASGLEVVRSLRLAVKATGSPSIEARLPLLEAKLRGGSSLTEAVASLELLDRTSLGSLNVAETTGTLAATLEKLSAELQESSLRATRLLIIAALAVVAVVVLVKIVGAVLGTILGPVKTLYDAAGSGSLDG